MSQKMIYKTPYDQFREHNGEPCSLTGHIKVLDDSGNKGSVLRQVVFSDGITLDAWDEKLWTDQTVGMATDCWSGRLPYPPRFD